MAERRGTIRPLMRSRLMPHITLRENEIRVEIIDQSGQRLPMPRGGLVVHTSRAGREIQVLVDDSGAVTNLAQVGLAGRDGKRMVLTLRCEVDDSFTVLGFSPLLDS